MTTSRTRARASCRVRKGERTRSAFVAVFRASLLAYCGLWALVGALWGLWTDDMAFIFPGAFCFYALFFWAIKELEGVER